MDAFVTARDNWIATIRDLERRRLLYDEKVNTKSWFFGIDKPTFVCIRTIFFQVMLLPVGFYFLVFRMSLSFMKGEDRPQDYFQWKTHDDLYVHIEESHHAHHHNKHRRYKKDDDVQEDFFDDYVNYTLCFAILRLVIVHVGRMVHKEGHRQVKGLTLHVARQALRNPISFSIRVKNILNYLRWLKYLGPIIATSNKFLQNLKDLLKKRRQEYEASVAYRLRRTLVKKRTPDEIRIHSAVTMQKVFRAKQARKAVRALQILQGNKETLAALRMQQRFRALLEQARERLRLKQEELAELKRKEKQLTGQSRALNNHERTRMYELHQELEKQTDFVLRKVLLRPNTRFIVWWKAAFVFAVIFEIAGKALQPEMEKRYKSYNKLVEHHFCPQLWSTLPVCNPEPPKLKLHRRFLFNLGRWVGNGRDKAGTTSPTATAAAAAAAQAITNSTTSKSIVLAPPTTGQPSSADMPWFCSPTAVRVQGATVSWMQFIIRRFDIFMACVFFLDVFISFFTGELDDETGVLKPPGWFPRYILPGVFLQCAVNPQMETTAKIIKWCLTEFILLGPVRVTRWTVALIVPLVLALHRAFQSLRRKLADRNANKTNKNVRAIVTKTKVLW